MFNIKDYFKKFASLESNSLVTRDTVSAALKDVCNLQNIPFEVKRGVLTLQTSPLVKSIVFTKKAALMSYLRSHGLEGKIYDVR